MENVDVKGPWWQAAGLPGLNDHFDISWASVGLGIQALHGGDPFYEKNGGASIKDEDTFVAILERAMKEFPQFKAIHNDMALYKKKESAMLYASEDSALRLHTDGDAKVNFNIVTRNKEFMDKFLVFWEANTTKTIPKGRVHVLISTQDGIEFKSMGVGSEPLERGNYTEDVLKGYDRIVADLTSSTPAGRVAILDGKPGTGKTFLVRALLNDVKDVIFIVVPPNLVAQLAQPGMIPALVELHTDRGEKPMVFVIEDADEVLAPRAADNMGSISAILNLGDGLLGKLLDIHIVATTNAHRQELDEAIMRPGRLSASVAVGPLTQEKAMEVFKRLTGREEGGPKKGATLAEVYQMARDGGWTPPRAVKKVGFELEETPDAPY